jgi:uncharacterized repeat protein (TIGR03803 family)
MKASHAVKQTLLALLVCILALPASAEWKEKVLYSFQGGTDGAYPSGGVVSDKQGNLYGATQQGGGTNCSPMAACGTVYQLVPPAKKGDPWTENVLHVFQGKQHNDGEFPSGGVIADAVGNIYGTSSYGGTGDCVLLGIKGGCGTVFELSPPQTKGDKWTYTILYSFKGGKDGYLPFGDLVFDSAGNLYGATYFGGGKGTTCNPYYQYCGTVFRMSPPKIKGGAWTEKVLHRFAGGADGANPSGGLVLGNTGVVYGTTSTGGNSGCKTTYSVGCGTAFALKHSKKTRGAWTEMMLHRFTGGDDGGSPTGGLIFDAKGALYGTGGGGAHQAQGVVFRLMSTSGGRWDDTTVYDFPSNEVCGASPLAGVVFDAEGSLYGTASEGGAVGGGTIYRLRPLEENSWACGVLYNFNGAPDGSFPASVLIFDAAGNLYGTTRYSGSGQACGNYGCGTVFTGKP